ncbi:sulfurtransferase TusA [bacterium BMS3Bbin06]|nr:sulfurtransferase TusA [bacterium BMS3Abin08]GBE35393.1 sulfurtransferase TusA [bacterium BMS3Bbin06]HDO35587.1 sulfurtransferase TusA family protein [Nitrospirota bacterium]HDY71590.1 sulfurtransferase TusA family protein [Nitrospirota bacterium]
MPELKTMEPSDTLDVLGRVCPYPLVLTKKKLEKMNSGDILKILSDAPASAEDSIPRFCEKKGFALEVVKLEDKGYWEIYIQKK